ncbi:hypothetical protein [Ketobacter sp.]|uniref:hypothetical protein n=1 Tax=Ketobacter sp. TaxID=2083498 RepID=UPI000F18E87F|nr:hypothetical protein [Ketobacter sp.]RLT97388.1 MAG: hypothetical protein D9N14_11445 [Ketobacter sp.]
MTLKQPIHLLCLLVLALSTNGLHAAGEKLQNEMQTAARSLTQLMPFIYNDSAFRDQKNQKAIEQNINSLIQVIEATPRLLNDHAITMQISQQSLLTTLKQAQSLYQSQAYATSQYLLSGVPVVCSSCHIQDGRPSAVNLSLDRSEFANDYSFAEFNYYLRNYQQAQSAYEHYLKEPAIQRSRIQSRKTLERLLDITLITRKDTQPAKTMLDQALQLQQLNLETKQVIQHWLTGLVQLSFSAPTLAQLETEIYQAFSEQFTLEHEFIFKEENRPKALLWRQQLHQTLRTKLSRNDTARALYLLSILERALGDQIDLSLAHLYLKECIHLKASPFSGKCLNEYENHLYFYYGGSSGEHLPPEILEELNRLKQQYQSDS